MQVCSLLQLVNLAELTLADLMHRSCIKSLLSFRACEKRFAGGPCFIGGRTYLGSPKARLLNPYQ